MADHRWQSNAKLAGTDVAPGAGSFQAANGAPVNSQARSSGSCNDQRAAPIDRIRVEHRDVPRSMLIPGSFLVLATANQGDDFDDIAVGKDRLGVLFSWNDFPVLLHGTIAIVDFEYRQQICHRRFLDNSLCFTIDGHTDHEEFRTKGRGITCRILEC